MIKMWHESLEIVKVLKVLVSVFKAEVTNTRNPKDKATTAKVKAAIGNNIIPSLYLT